MYHITLLCVYNQPLVAADPFYPALPSAAVSDPSDLMAAFGGGAPSNNGNGASGGQASPWDLGGLDPVPLMGQVRIGNTLESQMTLYIVFIFLATECLDPDANYLCTQRQRLLDIIFQFIAFDYSLNNFEEIWLIFWVNTLIYILIFRTREQLIRMVRVRWRACWGSTATSSTSTASSSPSEARPVSLRPEPRTHSRSSQTPSRRRRLPSPA